MSDKIKPPCLTPQSISELNSLFAEIPPKQIAEMLSKLYITYFADDTADLDTEFQRFYSPLYKLISTVEKLEIR